MANYYGKRPVFIFASGLLCGCYFWGAAAKDFKSLLWSNIVAAFAGSSTEALGAAIVNVSAESVNSMADARTNQGNLQTNPNRRTSIFCTKEGPRWAYMPMPSAMEIQSAR
jgi:hypothetical protein